MAYSGWRSRRTSGRRALLLSLVAGLSFGCNQTLGPSPYQVQIPILRATPTEYDVGSVRYSCLRNDDLTALIRELKAACLALGQTPRDCQAENP